MASLVDAVIFIPVSNGTADFVVSAAAPGWRTPAQAGAVNGATYRYRAYSANMTEWEIGTGVYTVGTTTLTRAVILASSNGGAAVNFTVAPSVALTIFSADFATPAQLAKVDFLSVTQAVDLDAMEAAIASYGTAATKNTGTGAGNVPLLDGSGLLDTSILPALAITDVNVVASQAAMLALTAQKGDIAIRTDQNKSYALSTNSPGTLADWKELLTPTDAVLSVATLTGAISAAALKTALAIAQADVAGLTTADSPQFTGIELGHATDTTLARVAAGRISVEGVELQKQPTANGIVARTAAGTAAARTITGTANEISVSNGDGVAGDPTLSLAAAAKVVGRQEFWIDAGGMKSYGTNGAADGSFDSGTNDILFDTKDFDQTTSESVGFCIGMPAGWNEGTVTFIPYWTASGGTAAQTCIFSLAGVALSNDDPSNTAVGTAQTSSDALLAVGDIHIGPESSAITLANTPNQNDLVYFKLSRDISDTLASDAQLIGIKLVLTFASANDS